MKRVIRRGVFETNSSSTHSITMCSEEEYDKWEKDETLLDEFNEQFLTKEEAIKRLKNDECYKDLDFTDDDAVDEALRDEGLYTSDRYFDDEYLESYERTYTTKNGEKVVAFGKYGMDN